MGWRTWRARGRVGGIWVQRLLAPILAAMGCELLYTARNPVIGALGRFVSLNSLLEQSDVVSLPFRCLPRHRPIDRPCHTGPHEERFRSDQYRAWRPRRSASFDGRLAVGSSRGAGLYMFTDEIRCASRGAVADTGKCRDHAAMSPGSRPERSTEASLSPRRIAGAWRRERRCCTAWCESSKGKRNGTTSGQPLRILR